MPGNKTVTFDRAKLDRFKIIYRRAEKEGKEVFDFEGGQWYIKYAKYAIEHLEDKFREQRKASQSIHEKGNDDR